MKHKKLGCILLSAVLVFALMPGVPGGSYENIAYAASGWQPKPTRTVTSSNFPVTISNGETVQINGPVNYTAATGKSPITIAANATAKLIINGSVTLNGANASGTKGATAAIYVPATSTLTIYSAHDEDLSTSTAAPQDTLTLKGGNAAAGGNGGKAEMTSKLERGNLYYRWSIGAGGNGGGGAAAAIGGNGGTGGNGGAAKACNVELLVNAYGHMFTGVGDDHKGASGNEGANGTAGTSAGTINLFGRLTLDATGGNGGAGGNGGSGSRGLAETSGVDEMVGGCGGGGGGGGGLAAPAIGAGGAGGSGGGSGGELSSDHRGTVEGCGGGGGGGGWPNGGGGGGGGAECSDAENKNDNTSYGGTGGSGGAAGQPGKAGESGHTTGTWDHGYDTKKKRYDAEPGAGGAGGYGVSSPSTAGGGSGGREKDNKYNAGAGGSGGSYVSKTAWNTQGNLILSTANNLNLKSNLSYNYGDGQGYGTLTAMTPYIVYDLMDCKVTLSSCTYPGTDNSATTSITSITYSGSTDRDRSLIGSSKSIATNRTTLAYMDQKHCNSGKVAITGADNSKRTTVMTNNAVVGVKNLNFTISKASINDVKISGNFINKTQGEAIPISVTEYRISSNSAYTAISNLCNTNGKKGPNVKWVVTKGSGTFTNDNSSSTNFTPKSESVTITATLSGMNDFNEFSKSITFRTTKKDLDSLDFSTGTPHPRKKISVILPDDIGDNPKIQWYTKSSASSTTETIIKGATSAVYTVQNEDAGKILCVKVTPSANSNYSTNSYTATVTKKVESHDYAVPTNNGFCTVCDEYQPAKLNTSGTYKGYYNITNGGQLFWFAALVNDDHAHAEFTTQESSANAVLSKNIDLEERDWTPIGEKTGLTYEQLGDVNDSTKKGDENAVEANAYRGIFKSSGTRRTISNLKITGQHLRAGLFATALDATLENFIVEGKITLPEENEFFTSRFNCVGGIASKMNGTKISDVVSNVDIVNTDGKYKHVGGIIGEVQNEATQIEKCLYKGEIHIINSNDCVGGIVGYSNHGAHIRYCANLGIVSSVKGEATASPYAGGILGYVNNKDATVKNCYNYGMVSNGGLSYEGAIVGCINKNYASGTDANFTDNYYLEGSASNNLGPASADIIQPTAKSEESFASGEVCYLVNSKTSKYSGAVWRQNVDNGKTPDDYPLFWADADSIVYEHSDGVYSNYPELISVDISWGAMEFTYSDGTWDPQLHEYVNPGWTVDEEDGDKVTVTNKSNVSLKAEVSFTPNSNYQTKWNLTGDFGSGGTVRTLLSRNGGAMTTRLALRSKTPSAILAKQAIGIIKVKISTI